MPKVTIKYSENEVCKLIAKMHGVKESAVRSYVNPGSNGNRLEYEMSSFSIEIDGFEVRSLL